MNNSWLGNAPWSMIQLPALHMPPEVRVTHPAADDDQGRDQGGTDDQPPEAGTGQAGAGPRGSGGRRMLRRDGHGVAR